MPVNSRFTYSAARLQILGTERVVDVHDLLRYVAAQRDDDDHHPGCGDGHELELVEPCIRMRRRQREADMMRLRGEHVRHEGQQVIRQRCVTRVPA